MQLSEHHNKGMAVDSQLGVYKHAAWKDVFSQPTCSEIKPTYVPLPTAGRHLEGRQERCIRGSRLFFACLCCSLSVLAWQLILAPQAKTLQTPPDTRFPPLQGKDETVLHIPFYSAEVLFWLCSSHYKNLYSI